MEHEGGRDARDARGGVGAMGSVGGSSTMAGAGAGAGSGAGSAIISGGGGATGAGGAVVSGGGVLDNERRCWHADTRARIANREAMTRSLTGKRGSKSDRRRDTTMKPQAKLKIRENRTPA